MRKAQAGILVVALTLMGCRSLGNLGAKEWAAIGVGTAGAVKAAIGVLNGSPAPKTCVQCGLLESMDAAAECRRKLLCESEPTPAPWPTAAGPEPQCNFALTQVGYPLGLTCNCFEGTDWRACAPTPSPAVTPSPAPAPGPSVVPTPASCPCFQRVGIARHGPEFSERADPKDHSKGWLVCHRYDSTPRFGRTKRGEPCNGEHHDSCSRAHAEPTPGPDGKAPQCPNFRQCEYPGGPRWGSHGGRKSRPTGYQFVICGLRGETYTVSAAPPAEPTDALGVPLEICQGAALLGSALGTF